MNLKSESKILQAVIKVLFLLFIISLLSCGKEEIIVSGKTTPRSTSNKIEFPLLLEDTIDNEVVVIFGSIDFPSTESELSNDQEVVWQMAYAYSPFIDGVRLFFKVKNNEQLYYTDQNGNDWDMYGNGISVANQEKKLKSLNSGFGFWFNFATKFDELDINREKTILRNGERPGSTDWLIPTTFVFDIAGKDGIQSLDFPDFTTIGTASMLPDDEDIVIVLKEGDQVKIYPHEILDYHEVVNDVFGGKRISLTYCPLAGTTKVYESLDSEFGVSGFLYNSTLLPYDRKTESLWRQLDGLSVYGKSKGQVLNIVQHTEMPWVLAKSLFDDFEILSYETGFRRDYKEYPYGDYLENDVLIVPVEEINDFIPMKERVFSIIINEKTIGIYRAYNSI